MNLTFILLASLKNVLVCPADTTEGLLELSVLLLLEKPGIYRSLPDCSSDIQATFLLRHLVLTRQPSHDFDQKFQKTVYTVYLHICLFHLFKKETMSL